MRENLEKMLNSFKGKDINIYISGIVATYLNIENMDFFVEEKYNSEEYLVLCGEDEKYFTILLDEVREVKINEDINEVRIIFQDLSLLQVWLEVE